MKNSGTMKKIYLFLIAAIVMAAGQSSCQKEELAKGTFTATTERFSTKDGKMILDGSNYSWEVNCDKIKVSRKVSGSNQYAIGTYKATSVNSTTNAATFTYEPATDEVDVTGSTFSDSYYAVFPAIIYENTLQNARTQIDLPAQQNTDDFGRLKNAPMYAEASATSRNLQFKNLCGIMRLSLIKSNTSVSRIVVTTPNNSLNGRFNVLFSSNTPSLVNAGYTAVDSNHSVTLTCAESQSIAGTGHNFDIALPAGSYSNLEIKIYDDDHSSVCTKTLQNGTLIINRAEYTVITLNGDSENHELDFETSSTLIDGELPGLFSINPTTQVRFSRGNLQYKACTATAHDLVHSTAEDNNTGEGDPWNYGEWRFAPNQWDRMFSTGVTANNSESSTEWIDLLRWGSSGYMGHYPYYLGAAPATIEGNNYDWGVFNAISFGGNEPGLWRTLTKGEFEYILNSRGSNKWVRACVHGVNGIILQPDAWIGSTPSVSISWNSSSQTWTAVSDDDWRTLEDAGAVFLPVTGRLGNTSNSVNQTSWANYWTATNSSTTNAFYIQIKPAQLATANQDKKYGCAVRLVRNAN